MTYHSTPLALADLPTPGGVVDLHYRFTHDHSTITALVIEA